MQLCRVSRAASVLAIAALLVFRNTMLLSIGDFVYTGLCRAPEQRGWHCSAFALLVDS